jgi:hypothetical protein
LINPGAEFNATTGFMLAHEVMPDKTEAKYESGLLRIFAPMKDWEHKVNVMVQQEGSTLKFQRPSKFTEGPFVFDALPYPELFFG